MLKGKRARSLFFVTEFTNYGKYAPMSATLNWLKSPMPYAIAAFAAVAGAGMASHDALFEDPSLRAAPAYEPEKWNDVSYEQLNDLYKKHAPAIERIIAVSYKEQGKDPEVVFRRGAQTPSEKTFIALSMARDYIGANPKNNISELSDAMAARYKIHRLSVMSLVFDAQKLYKPGGYQQTNNCLAYSTNDRAHSFDPNDYQGHAGTRTMGEAAWSVDPYKAKNYEAFVRQTVRGNISDGMIFTGKDMKSREGFYRVALYTRPIDKDVTQPVEAMDYHYIRQNRDGGWSHKFGAFPVNNLDYAGKPITHPEKADMGAYRFIGYFLVPQGGLDVGPGRQSPVKTAEISATAPAHTPR